MTFWRWIISVSVSTCLTKRERERETERSPHPHLRASSGRRSWRPVPSWTPRLWAALPAGPAEPPGSLCSRRRHGCSPISCPVAPSSSPSLCVRRREASFRCCWGHFVVAGRERSFYFRMVKPQLNLCCFKKNKKHKDLTVVQQSTQKTKHLF